MDDKRYTRGPCPFPGCGSSDAFTTYSDGVGHCFSCGKSKKVETEMDSYEPATFNELTRFSDIDSYRSYGISSRGISKEIVDYFKVKMSITPEGLPESHFYPYTKNGKIVAYKERKLPKTFSVHGDFKDVELFGQEQSVGSKMLVITEGELDALAVAQAYKQKYGRIYPVVSLPSASGINTLLAQRVDI